MYAKTSTAFTVNSTTMYVHDMYLGWECFNIQFTHPWTKIKNKNLNHEGTTEQ